MRIPWKLLLLGGTAITATGIVTLREASEWWRRTNDPLIKLRRLRNEVKPWDFHWDKSEVKVQCKVCFYRSDLFVKVPTGIYFLQ